MKVFSILVPAVPGINTVRDETAWVLRTLKITRVRVIGKRSFAEVSLQHDASKICKALVIVSRGIPIVLD